MCLRRKDVLVDMMIILIFFVSIMVKSCAFSQPDRISITFYKEDLYVKENFIYSSLFTYKTLKCFDLKCRRKSMLLLPILLCGDIKTQPGPEMLSRAQFQTFLSRKGLKITHQNITGLESNFEMLQEFVTSLKKIDIISLSETHLTDESYSDYSLPSYNFIFRNRDQGKGGGVAMFIKDKIIYKRRGDLEKNMSEYFWIEIFTKHSKSFPISCF